MTAERSMRVPSSLVSPAAKAVTSDIESWQCLRAPQGGIAGRAALFTQDRRARVWGSPGGAEDLRMSPAAAVAGTAPARHAARSANTIRLRVTRLSALLTLERPEPVSHFLAATIRGGFGTTLRGLVCANRGAECPACILQQSCAYSYLFESAPPVDAVRLRAYRDIPRPFTLRPRQDGNRLSVGIAVVGRAAAYVPYFLHTLNALGQTGLGKRRVRFQVADVRDWRGQLVYPLRDKRLATQIPAEEIVVKPGRPRQRTVVLHLVSPLSIRRDGRVLASFDKRAFFTTLLRRVTNLDAFYGDRPGSAVDPEAFLAPVAALVAQADTKPVVLQRLSTRVHRTIELDGITGTVRLQGDVGTLMPLLKAGEMLGVGKNTVFGFGEIRVQPIAEGRRKEPSDE